MIYTIDDAIKELHDKDDECRQRYCWEKYKRECETCSLECHLSFRAKKREYHKTLGLICNKNCKNNDCENNPNFGVKSVTLN